MQANSKIYFNDGLDPVLAIEPVERIRQKIQDIPLDGFIDLTQIKYSVPTETLYPINKISHIEKVRIKTSTKTHQRRPEPLTPKIQAIQINFDDKENIFNVYNFLLNETINMKSFTYNLEKKTVSICRQKIDQSFMEMRTHNLNWLVIDENEQVMHVPNDMFKKMFEPRIEKNV